MSTINLDMQDVKRVLVATDRSETADRVAQWAAKLAASYRAELLVFQVLPSSAGMDGAAADIALAQAAQALQQFADQLAGGRGRARVVVDSDPVQAVLDAIEEEQVDVVVVGNAGMSGRKQFLLGNISNRISHNARCTVIIVNTADTHESNGMGERRRGRPAITPPHLEGRLLGRAFRISRVMVKAGARELLTRVRPDDDVAMQVAAKRFRAALDELGPTFAKLGQMLSTRPDLLPPPFVEEFASLQERVTPLGEAEVVSVMEQELGVPWEDVFESIDPDPMAAGTIAQVHRATLESGERVVVKVQRPTAEQDILQDLGLLEMLAQRASSRPALRRVFDMAAIIDHLSASLRRELDFRGEAANITRMQAVLTPFPRLGVPRVYDEYSTARLLVMQEIEGVPAREAPPGRARKEAARQLFESYYHQVMNEGFFHADPHPGNMKWWNNRLYLLDFGMVGEVDLELRESILLLLMAFSHKDSAFLSELVIRLASGDTHDEALDFGAFQTDLARLVTRYRHRSLREIQLGPLLQEITEVSIRHNIRVPASLTLTGKAFAQMQLVAAELDPTLDPFSVAESFILRSILRQIATGASPRKLFYEMQKAQVRLVRGLEAIEGLVGARPGAALQVNFRGTEQLEQTISLASRRLSLAIGLSGTLVVTAITANSTRVPRWVPATVAGIGSALAARLVVERPRRKS